MLFCLRCWSNILDKRKNECSIDYVNILEKVLLPYAEEKMAFKWEFMQANDSIHSSKLIKKWFQDQKINVMEWPTQSLDLNPIEHM